MTPHSRVLDSFGLVGNVEPLLGGSRTLFRAGGVVLKKVDDSAEAAWIQELSLLIEEDRFRIARPIASGDGRWVVDGWTASEFVPWLRPAAPSWSLIIDVGHRFGTAADRVLGDLVELPRRNHRWAVADRVAWDEADAPLPAVAAEIAERARRRFFVAGAALDDRGLIHGDLAGNVFVDASGLPVVLDVSPYLRPPRLAAAIVVVDAVLWHGADVSLARQFVVGPGGAELFGRALIFRLVADCLGPRLLPEKVERYGRLVSALSE